MSARVRVAVCQDFREEGWPSMDRVADALVDELRRGHADRIDAALVAPPFRRRASRVLANRTGANVDRGINRLFDYPRHMRDIASRFDVFHVVDHSYAQIVHRLPGERTVVTCHDLDTFRSLIDPAQEVRSAPFKAMTRHILAGLGRAAYITCDTAAVRDELVRRNLVPSARLVVAPVGVASVFSPAPDAEADATALRLTSTPPGAIEILHVGSTVARKRIDVVLRVTAAVARAHPQVRLVRVGGPFTAEQQQLAGELGLASRISVLPSLDDRALAAIYRRAALVVLPSEREGFGLPVVEAMACGAPVAASDLAVLREVGGGVAEHCQPGDLDEWIRTVERMLGERGTDCARARRSRGIEWARRFTWAGFAATMADVYEDLARAGAARASESATCPA